MHAVFKDVKCRLLGGAVDVDESAPCEWLPDDPAVVTCEVYRDARGKRGKLVALYDVTLKADSIDGARAWRRGKSEGEPAEPANRAEIERTSAGAWNVATWPTSSRRVRVNPGPREARSRLARPRRSDSRGRNGRRAR